MFFINQLDYSLDKDFVYITQNKTSPHWSLQGGYKTKNIDVHPKRVLGPGARDGIKFDLKTYKNDTDSFCLGRVQGFKITLHTPGEIPRVSKDYFRIPLGQEVVVSVKPNMITTSDGLIEYAPKRRQCFFNDEKFLKFFKIYSQSNCELECLSNFTLKACGCVKFSMPRDSVTQICNQKQIQCFNEAEDELTKAEFREYESGYEENKIGKINCNCLPSCTSIKYDVEITQNEFKFVEFNMRMNFISIHRTKIIDSGFDVSRLRIFFIESKVITTKRSEIYSMNDFLSDCGGILGLFMGVSFVSVIELIYYFTLRLACNRKTFNETINPTKTPIDETAGKEMNVNLQQIITVDGQF